MSIMIETIFTNKVLHNLFRVKKYWWEISRSKNARWELFGGQLPKMGIVQGVIIWELLLLISFTVENNSSHYTKNG